MKKKQVNLYKSLLLLLGILYLGITLSCSNNIQNVRDFLKDTHATDEGSKIHVHTFATEWSSDASGHWHVATCEHTEEISDYAEHTYGEWNVVQAPKITQEGKNERTCSGCGDTDSVVLQPAPEGFVFVKGTTINGNESWTPESDVFVGERKLTIPDLIVSDHEVTRGEYKAVMGKDPSTAYAYDKNGNKLTGEDVLNNPVNDVNWYDALVYCNKRSMQENLTPCYTINSSTDPDDWGEVPTSRNNTWNAATCDFNANGYRLPTEAEWEWLARGGENYTYAGSDTIDDVAWYTENTNGTGTRDVKTKAPNGYGLYDMSGNVWEWCWDWSGDISYNTAAYGATSGANRVMRGGCWNSTLSDYCAVSNRTSDPPTSCRNVLGFRVVRTPTE